MIRVFLRNIQQSALLIFGVLSALFFFRSKSLSKDNERLKRTSKDLRAMLKLKQKVINVRKNNKPTNIDGNLERMRQEKL